MENKLLEDYLKPSPKDTKRVSKFFTKVLICLIILLISLIGVRQSETIRDFYKKYVYEDSFKFMDFKKLYNKYFGKFEKNEDQMVIGNTSLFSNPTTYLNGESFSVPSQSAIENISGGIVVFTGQKDGYNNTVIVQTSDGYDIWYGNLSTVGVNIYDYIEANTIIGTSNENLYLLITKDSKYYTYNNYLNA